MKFYLFKFKKLIRHLKHKILIRLIQYLHISIIKRKNSKTKLLNIDIGSGSTLSIFNDFICTDIHNFNLLNKRQMAKFLNKYKIRHIIAEHIFEHLTQEEMIKAISNLNSFMEIGSRIRIAIPDGYNPSTKYIKNVDINGCGPGAEDHKQLLNYHLVNKIFKKNFPNHEIQFIEYFDEKNLFHSNTYINIGKDITRSSLSKSYNKSFELSHLSLIFDFIKTSR